MKKVFIFCITMIICLYPHCTTAQNGSLFETAVDVSLYPSNPKPNQEVSVTTHSYATDINNATITYTLNGKVAKTGTGQKNFSFTVGDAGVLTTLAVTVRTAEGEVITKTFRIRPSSIDLIWYTDGYTPPFYKGKSYFSHQNIITFVAIPYLSSSNGTTLSPNTLSYKWTINGDVMENNSGYGKNTFKMRGNVLSRNIEVKVEASSPQSLGTAESSTVIAPIEPIVLLYKKDPAYGINFDEALVNQKSIYNQEETTILAVPYFFGAIAAEDDSLSYKWSINNTRIENTGASQVFRPKAGTRGSSRIGVVVENKNNILQRASSAFTLEFSSPNNE